MPAWVKWRWWTLPRATVMLVTIQVVLTLFLLSTTLRQAIVEQQARLEQNGIISSQARNQSEANAVVLARLENILEEHSLDADNNAIICILSILPEERNPGNIRRCIRGA